MWHRVSSSFFSCELKFPSCLSEQIKYSLSHSKNPMNVIFGNDKMWTSWILHSFSFGVLSPDALLKVSLKEWTESLVTKELRFLILSSYYKWQLRDYWSIQPCVHLWLSLWQTQIMRIKHSCAALYFPKPVVVGLWPCDLVTWPCATGR